MDDNKTSDSCQPFSFKMRKVSYFESMIYCFWSSLRDKYMFMLPQRMRV